MATGRAAKVGVVQPPAFAILFLHIEIQAQPTAQFPWRMWVYYYRLCDKYGPSVISLAILADADPRWRPHTYETAIAGCGLRFEFPDRRSGRKWLSCPPLKAL